MQAEDVMSLLRSFCSDASYAVTPRLDVLKVLERVSHKPSILKAHHNIGVCIIIVFSVFP